MKVNNKIEYPVLVNVNGDNSPLTLAVIAKLILIQDSFAHCHLIMDGKGYSPYAVVECKREIIRKGDKYYSPTHEKISECIDDNQYFENDFKVILTPDKFNNKNKELIIDKLAKVNDEIIIECENDYSQMPDDEDEIDLPWRSYVKYKIKLDSSGFALIHKPIEKPQFTKSQVLKWLYETNGMSEKALDSWIKKHL